MRTRYISNNLSCSTSLYSPILLDPIFTPLFTAVIGTGGVFGMSTATAASVLSAITTTKISKGVQFG